MPPADRLLHLRTITSLLLSTQESELPSHTSQLASLLYSSPILDSAIALAADQTHRARAEEASVLVNKFKTRISSLLQSRSAQARWCGVVLVKCSVESSFEALATWGAVWTRLMVPLITRPEPSSTHLMVVRTLTRISTALTADKPSLTREIVTPNIPAVFTGLLGLVATYTEDLDTAVLSAVLESLRDLITAHPVTFRPFFQKTRTAVVSLLSTDLGPEIEGLCCGIYVSSHLCASGSGKRGSGQSADGSSGKQNAVATEWNTSISTVIAAVHTNLDSEFAPIEEDQSHRQSIKNGTTTPEGPELKGSPELLLRLLEAYFTCSAPSQPLIPIPQLLDLTARILSVTASSQRNPAIETKYREALFCRLPSLHVAAFELLNSITNRLQKHFIPFIPWILEQLSDTFAEERWSSDLRTSCYILSTALFSLTGPSLSKSMIESAHTLISSACDDLVPPSQSTPALPPKSTQKLKASQKSTATSHADTLLSATKQFTFTSTSTIAAAASLLTASLSFIPGNHIRSELRAKMERAAVLTENTDALIAAVLFPRPTATVTLVPHLVGARKTGLAVEGIVRPRLPVIWTGPTRTERKAAEEARLLEEDEEEDEAGMADDAEYERGAKRMRFEEPNGNPPNPPVQLQDTRLPGETSLNYPTLPDLSPAASTQTSSTGLALPLDNAPSAKLIAGKQKELNQGKNIYPGLSISEERSKTTVTNAAHVVEKVKTRRMEIKTVRDDDDDLDMEDGIPEIVLGDSSSEDEDDGGEW